MITFAKLKHFEDEEFKKCHAEVAEYHKKRVNYPFDWSRQWEYPWILKNLPLNKEQIAADAGGGYCYFPCIFGKRVKEIVVIDKNDTSLNHCITWTPRFIHQNLENIKTDEKFDVVVCVSVLEHIWDYFSAIKRMTELVKPGGYLAITMDCYLEDSHNCKFSQISTVLDILKEAKMNPIGEVDLSTDGLYFKQELMKTNPELPNVDRFCPPDMVSLGIIVKKEI